MGQLRVLLHKHSNEQHALELVRADGVRERMECETRSYLQHDFLHYAVEAEAGLEAGFWGNLARGKTLEQMNDRSGRAMAAEIPELMTIERTVGALTRAVKGGSASEIVASVHGYEASLGLEPTPWLSEALVLRVQERMRALLGHWKATPYGGTMALRWPAER